MDRGVSAHGAKRVGRRVVTALLAALVIVAVVAPTAGAGEAPAARAAASLPKAKMAVGGVPLTVELATTAAAKAQGLGNRARLKPGRGMLFVEETAARQTFWMKGMRFCLDIVWIEGGEVVGAAERVCPDPPRTADEARPRYSSPGPVRYVLEVPAGWLKANGLGVGSPVELPARVA